MKRIVTMLCAALALYACTKEYPVTPEVEDSSAPLGIQVDISYADATKAALKNGWEAGDVVYMFLAQVEEKYLEYSYDGTDWKKVDRGGEITYPMLNKIPADQHYVTAVYIPHYDVNVNYNTTAAAFELTDAATGKPCYTYYLSATKEYTYDKDNLYISVKLEKPDGFVQFFVNNVAESDVPTLKLRESHIQPRALSAVHVDGQIAEDESLPMGYAMDGFFYGGGALFAGHVSTVGVETEYDFQLVTTGGTAKPYAITTATFATKKAIPAGVVANLPQSGDTRWTHASKWVDMGAAGKWATGNLKDDGGTTKGEINIVAPEETGMYYAWAGTAGRTPTAFTWNGNTTYTFNPTFNANNSPYWSRPQNRYTKYSSSSSTVLEAGDDAATQNIGDGWCMPTKAGWDALVNPENSIWQYVATADGYARAGYLCTSKATGLGMFLPMAGRGQYNLINTTKGYYWSSTLYYSSSSPSNKDTRAYALMIEEAASPGTSYTENYRTYGESIRAMRK